jgi:hypothetical protein
MSRTNIHKCVPITSAGAFVSLGVVTQVSSASSTAVAEPAEGNRLLEHAAWILSRLDGLDADARARLEQMLEIEPDEAVACLEGQARAAARSILTSDEALTIYRALTPEGWEPGTRLELKMTIVSLMDRLFAPLCRRTAASPWSSNWTPSAS